MTFRTYTRIVEGRIDPAPMVDVVFLLLIFIILSSPFVLQTGQKVDLVKDPRPTDFSFQTLVVTVSRDNLLFFNGQPTTLDSLRQSLTREARFDRKAELIIKADRQVTHEMVIKIMSMAFEAGISQVNLATRPEVPAAGPPK
jgi:biopolymer transport protein ExbD